MVVQVYDLHSYILQNVMEPLVKRELWSNKAIWTGWAKCAAMLQPLSYPLLVQLPADVLDETLKVCLVEMTLGRAAATVQLCCIVCANISAIPNTCAISMLLATGQRFAARGFLF
jgi:hypothetical protein